MGIRGEEKGCRERRNVRLKDSALFSRRPRRTGRAEARAGREVEVEVFGEHAEEFFGRGERALFGAAVRVANDEFAVENCVAAVGAGASGGEI